MTSTATRTGHDAGDARRRELAAFLRSRRERITPQEVGVALAGRRRTPGLRREEVAQLSGVGVTWYTWLEQGRDINASEQVLSAIARTLMLTGDERSHLFVLAGAADLDVRREGNAVNEHQRALLAKLDPYPAAVLSAKYDVLAHNRTYGKLIVDMDALPPEDRNCIWLAFTHPEWRRRALDRDDGTQRMVANLRTMMADHVADPAWKALVARLTEASPEFAALWARHEVLAVQNKPKRLRHPVAGRLSFHTTNTWLAPRAGTRMVVYVPADGPTEQRIALVAESG